MGGDNVIIPSAGWIGTLTLYARGDSASVASGDNTIRVTGDAWKSPSGRDRQQSADGAGRRHGRRDCDKIDLDVDSNKNP